MNKHITLSAVGLALIGTVAWSASPLAAAGGDTVVIRAGHIHTMDAAGTITNGSIVVQDGRILAVGADLDVPSGAQVVDYGPDAHLIPGLVVAESGFGRGMPGPRTADAALSAVDNFDLFADRRAMLASGVTSAYIDPAGGRLLGGLGGVVKLGGAKERAIVSAMAAVDGSVASDAYRTQGFWEPPVPATVDVGMGVEMPQLPHSLQGAVSALDQLLLASTGAEVDEDFGPYAAADLAKALEAGATWRLTAGSASELRAVANFATANGQTVVVDGAHSAADVADVLAAANVGVVFQPRQRLGTATNWGKGEDAEWPTLDVPAALAKAGVRFAIAPSSNTNPANLLALATLCTQGGLSPQAALAAVTSDAAVLIGAAGRVGSLASGKDADFVVLSGEPMTLGSSVRATWVDGELGFLGKSEGVVVLEVEELFVGDGQVLRPGQLLMKDGRILEVGERVAHPKGATVIRGEAAMPGIIDALGHFGMDGSRKVAPAGFSMTRVLTPDDADGRRIAKAGVTTVMLSPYSIGGGATSLLAYKPAGADYESMVVEDDAAVRMIWSSSDRYRIGSNVTSMLEKAVKYKESWEEYEAAMAEWTPPAPKVEKAEEGKDEDKAEDAEESEEDDGKKKKKEKDLDPLTGVWESTSDWGKARFQFSDGPSEGTTEVRGSLRASAVADRLMRFEGTFDHKKGKLSVHGVKGDVGLVVTGELDDEKLEGKIEWRGASFEFEAERTSREYVIASRPEVRKPEPDPKDPKGMPKEPNLDPNLEPLRRALMGEVAVIVQASRDDEILDCVAAFEAVGIKPVLLGAEDAWRVKDQISGRIAGILPDRWPTRSTSGLESVNRFAELQAAGIPVAFYSAAEEGAADLLLLASFAMVEGMSPAGALRALTADSADMLDIDDRVGRLAMGLDADVLLLDGSPLDGNARVQRTWVAGREIVD
ncbi:MAG: amidohydrolase family protein [Planctomycetota bacterium]|nr:amidohydrolase family protein [Planctomycetota bacterium]